MRGIGIVRSNVQHGIDEQIRKISAFAQSEGIDVNHTVVIEADADLNNIEYFDADCVFVVDESRISRDIEIFEAYTISLSEKNIALKVINPN